MHRIYLTIIAVLVAVILYLTIGAGSKGPEPAANAPSPTPSVSEVPEPVANAPIPTPSVAVLRFAAMENDDGANALAATLSARIVESLSATQGISVIPDQFAMPGESIGSVARRLESRYVLEGSSSESDGKLRVTAQLTDAETEAALWSETYEGDAANYAYIADDIAAAVARRLHP